MISDAEVEKAIDYLRDNSWKASISRANRIYVEEYRKVMKAQIMKERAGEPLGAQERDAYADPRYIEHLKAIREAVQEDEYHRFMRTTAEAKIEAWRTQQANARGERKAFS
jgi:hypothetical protein